MARKIHLHSHSPAVLTLLKSRLVSRIVKSTWNGAICSLNISRCFTSKSSPSIAVYTSKRKALFSSLRIQYCFRSHNFILSLVYYLPLRYCISCSCYTLHTHTQGLLGESLKNGSLNTTIQSRQTNKGASHCWIPHTMEVSR